MNNVFILNASPIILFGKGESEVLSLAMHKGTNVKVVLDDLQARKCAKLLDIELIGSLGLLIRAKQVGLVKTVKPEKTSCPYPDPGRLSRGFYGFGHYIRFDRGQFGKYRKL